MNKLQAKPWLIVLGGGGGSRLKELFPHIPKGLIQTEKGSVVGSIFQNAAKYEIKNIHFCLGHLANAYLDYFQQIKHSQFKISYSMESSPLGTGGALKACLPQIEGEQMIVVNGDTFVDPEIDRLVLAEDESFDGSILCSKVQDAADFGLVEIKDGKIKAFKEKARGKAGYVNAGVYCFKKESLNKVNKSAFSLEEELLPILNLKAVTTEKSFYDIGTPERLEKIKGNP